MKDVKATTYVVTVVDLQCSKCYRKIKKLLCRYNEIRDKVYDVQKNTVTIKVFCCTPERIRRELICKGCKFIRCISIPPPPSPPSPPPSPPSPPAESPPRNVNVNITVQTCCQQWYGVPSHCGCGCCHGGCTQWRYGRPCYCGCGGCYGDCTEWREYGKPCYCGCGGLCNSYGEEYSGCSMM